MAPLWEAEGVRLRIVTESDADPPADVAWLHVDQSVVPASWQARLERFPRVINGRVLDIRKRRISANLVSRYGEDPGPVIVKSDLNCGGFPDFRHDTGAALRPLTAILGRRAAGALLRGLARFEARRAWQRRRILPTGAYRVFPRRRDVPEGVWANPNLVVERFLPERDGRWYCCRHWVFLGSREVQRFSFATDPVVKARDNVRPLPDPVPPELRALRQRLGFDYGKFDYGIVDGRVVLYDVNRTPGITDDWRRHLHTAAGLYGGLRDFLEFREVQERGEPAADLATQPAAAAGHA